MTKTKNTVKFFLYNSAFATFLYLGVIQGIPGFMNVVEFLIGFFFIVFVLGLFNEESQIRVYEEEKNRIKLGIIGHLITAAYVGVLVFYGHILLGVIYLISVLIGYAMIQRGKELAGE